MGKNKAGQVRRRKRRFFSDIKFSKKIFFVSSASLISVLTIFIFSVFFVVKASDNRKIKSESMMSDSAAGYLGNIIDSAVSITKTYYYSTNLYDFIDTDFSDKEYNSEYAEFIQNNGWLEMKNSLMKRFTIYTQNNTVGNTGIINFLSTREQESYWYKEFRSQNKKTAAFYDDSVKSIVLVRVLDNFPLESGEAIIKIVLNRELIIKDLKSFSFDGTFAVKYGNYTLFSDGVIDEEDDFYSSHPQESVAADFECLSYSGEKGLKGIPERWFFIVPFIISLCISLLSINFLMAEIKERIDYLHNRCSDDVYNIRRKKFRSDGSVISYNENQNQDYRELLHQKYYSDVLKEQIRVFSDIRFGRRIVFASVSSVLSVMIIFLCSVYFIVRMSDKEKTATEEIMTNSAVCYLDNAVESVSSISKSFYYSEKLSSFIDTNYSKSDYYSNYFDFKHNNDLLNIKNAFISGISIYTENNTIEPDDLFALLENEKSSFWYKHMQELGNDISAFYDGTDQSIVAVRKLDNFPSSKGESVLKITLNKDIIAGKMKEFAKDGEMMLKCSDGVIFSTGNIDSSSKGCSEIMRSDVVHDFELISYAHSKSSDNLLYKFYFYIPLLVSLCISFFSVMFVMSDTKKRVKVLHSASEKDFYSTNPDFYAGKDELGSVYKNLLNLKNLDETVNKMLAQKDEESDGQNNTYENAFINAYQADACLRYMQVCRCPSDELIKNTDKIPLRDELKYTKIYLDDYSRSGRERFDYILAVDPSVDVDRARIIPYGLAELAGYFSEYSGYGHDLVISVKEEIKYIGFKFECKNISVNPSDILKFRAIFESNDDEVLPDFEVLGRNNPCIRLKNYYGKGVNLEIYSTEELNLEIFIKKEQL